MQTSGSDGFTQLFAACRAGQLAVASLLIEAYPPAMGQRLESDGVGCTPLHIACMSDHFDIASLLLGKDPIASLISFANNYGQCALDAISPSS